MRCGDTKIRTSDGTAVSTRTHLLFVDTADGGLRRVRPGELRRRSTSIRIVAIPIGALARLGYDDLGRLDEAALAELGAFSAVVDPTAATARRALRHPVRTDAPARAAHLLATRPTATLAELLDGADEELRGVLLIAAPPELFGSWLTAVSRDTAARALELRPGREGATAAIAALGPDAATDLAAALAPRDIHCAAAFVLGDPAVTPQPWWPSPALAFTAARADLDPGMRYAAIAAARTHPVLDPREIDFDDAGAEALAMRWVRTVAHPDVTDDEAVAALAGATIETTVAVLEELVARRGLRSPLLSAIETQIGADHEKFLDVLTGVLGIETPPFVARHSLIELEPRLNLATALADLEAAADDASRASFTEDVAASASALEHHVHYLDVRDDPWLAAVTVELYEQARAAVWAPLDHPAASRLDPATERLVRDLATKGPVARGTDWGPAHEVARLWDLRGCPAELDPAELLDIAANWVPDADAGAFTLQAAGWVAGFRDRLEELLGTAGPPVVVVGPRPRFATVAEHAVLGDLVARAESARRDDVVALTLTPLQAAWLTERGSLVENPWVRVGDTKDASEDLVEAVLAIWDGQDPELGAEIIAAARALVS